MLKTDLEAICLSLDFSTSTSKYLYGHKYADYNKQF